MMKRILLIVTTLTLSLSLFAQKLDIKTFQWDGIQREYTIYVPSNLDTAQPRGLLLMLHGLGNTLDTVDQLVHPANFCEMSGWICVTPLALSCSISTPLGDFNIGPCWNAGITATAMGTTVSLNGDVDDVGFIISLMNHIRSQYNIADDSLFVGGVSMGGFMTHRLLIEAGQYFAAAIPISGTIANTLEDTLPQHQHHPRIMHIHSPNDDVVTWNGDFTYRLLGLTVPHIGMSVDNCVNYWINHNQCDPTPITDTLEDRYDDGLLVIRHRHLNGLDSSEVTLMEVQGGKHTYYGDPNIYDIDYSIEIYKFITGKQIPYPPVGISSPSISEQLTLFPNPSSGNTSIALENISGKISVQIIDMKGNTVLSHEVSGSSHQLLLPTQSLPKGIYLVRLLSNDTQRTSKLVKR